MWPLMKDGDKGFIQIRSWFVWVIAISATLGAIADFSQWVSTQ